MHCAHLLPDLHKAQPQHLGLQDRILELQGEGLPATGGQLHADIDAVI